MTTRAMVAAVLVLGACAGDATGDGRGADPECMRFNSFGECTDSDAVGRAGDAGTSADDKPSPDAVPGPTPGSWRYPTAAWRCECIAFLTADDAQAYRAGVTNPSPTTFARGMSRTMGSGWV